jgi:hypothetical protein
MRFTTNVWLGSSYVNKVCKFIQPGTKLAVTMPLRVYDVSVFALTHWTVAEPVTWSHA